MKQEKLEKILQESLYVHKEIPEENEENGAYNKWLKKEVKNKLILFKCDNKNIEKVILNGRGKVTIDNETFPYRTLKIETNTDIENVYPRPNTAIKISFDEIDLSNYNRISVLVYPKAIGYHNFYFHFTTGNTGYELLHAPSLIPNQWNHVVWEINNLKRDKVNHLSIAPFLMGCPPEAKEDYVIYIKDITVEEVDKTYEKGWDLEDRIAYSHSGYQTNSLKQAIIQGNFSDNLPYFYLCDENNNIVFNNNGSTNIIKDNDYGTKQIFKEFTGGSCVNSKAEKN